MICPLCSSEFDETDHGCAAGCPIASVQGCHLVCCPHCGYQMVDESRSALARGLRRLLGGRASAPKPAPGKPAGPADPAAGS